MIKQRELELFIDKGSNKSIDFWTFRHWLGNENLIVGLHDGR